MSHSDVRERPWPWAGDADRSRPRALPRRALGGRPPATRSGPGRGPSRSGAFSMDSR